MRKVKEIIVVEGKNDTLAVKRAVEADTIETRGSAIPSYVLDELRRAQAVRGLIVFTDPDYAGERIRRIISQEIPEVKHAFIEKELAYDRQKIGVEHANPSDIVKALENVRTLEEEIPSWLSWKEYLVIGLAGHPHSKQLREKLAKELSIGYANAKQFFVRLQTLRISREECERALLNIRGDRL
ncbi:ribonuclease M5 [Shimazuella sp. AN120528]|uniref:ribonuclease M5 n=1 Tax=Shimazuella soli TaxID=1892854 RepID=UPI001F0F2CE3|nr:ribonuclease M5 [Shimazuella soli]MCH5585843.1 ribonuclease M5 [Shimazuella soli]